MSPPSRPGRKPSEETRRLVQQAHAMLPEDDETRELIEQCQRVDQEEAQQLQREFRARREAEGEEPLLARHRIEAAERRAHGAQARHFAEIVIAHFNEHYRERAWGVVTTLVGQYLTVADASSRFDPIDGLPLAEAMPEYWPNHAPKSLPAQVCFTQAFRAGLAVRQGLWLDSFHDRYPSRQSDEQPKTCADGIVRMPHRDIAIGVDGSGRPVIVKQRAKWELYASTFIEHRSYGAWIGLMASKPPDDWCEVRMLGNENWRPEFGHPACILPEGPGTVANLLHGSVLPMLSLAGSGLMTRVAQGIERVWSQRRRKGVLLDEPSFAPFEAIKLLGATVGINPQSEAAARNVFRFCWHRARAGALDPAWSLRLCRHDACTSPLFIHEVAPGQGDAPPPNYCRICSPQQEAHRRKRSRRRASLREEARQRRSSSACDYPSVELPKLTPEEFARGMEQLRSRHDDDEEGGGI